MSKIKKETKEIEKYLKKNNVDWWLIYDFQWRNNIAVQLLQSRMTTRRRFALIDKNWEITFLVSGMEKDLFVWLWENIIIYTTNNEFHDWVKKLLNWIKTVYMEYSPMWVLPTVSYVDGGTIDLVKNLGVEVYSSGTLVQICSASWWWKSWIDSHKRALSVLYSCMDYVKKQVSDDIKNIWSSDEYKIQQGIMNILEQNHMETNHPCVVSNTLNSSNPHYFPTKDRNSQIKKWDLIMVDIWCREKATNSIYADITWMFFVWNELPSKINTVWQILKWARDAWINYLQDNLWKEIIRWCDVDYIVRKYILDNGYGQYFTHRTGHSIQHEDHASGVNIDSYEIQDTREIIDDCGFSIEPWIYIPSEFGIRSEVDVYIDQCVPKIFGPVQSEIIFIN